MFDVISSDVCNIHKKRIQNRFNSCILLRILCVFQFYFTLSECMCECIEYDGWLARSIDRTIRRSFVQSLAVRFCILHFIILQHNIYALTTRHPRIHARSCGCICACVSIQNIQTSNRYLYCAHGYCYKNCLYYFIQCVFFLLFWL